MTHSCRNDFYKSGSAGNAIMDQVELTVSDAFQKHKRNLLTLASVTCILWVSTPKNTIKIPGIDVSLPVQMAFWALTLGLIYFGASFVLI